ncbi:MAG: hypothetical protein U1A78_08170 [Polyangia bacterium]
MADGLSEQIPRARARRAALLGLLGGLWASGCSPTVDHSLAVTVPLSYRDGILFAAGSIQPTLNEACGEAPVADPPQGSGAPKILIDTATPITSFTTPMGGDEERPQPFVHGQIALTSAEAAGSPTRFLLCDVPVVRTGVPVSGYSLSFAGKDSGALGGVLGGDLLLRYALGLRFLDAAAGGGAELTLGRSDIATSCQVDDAVLPFKLLGGELAVRVSDTVLTYPASRVTVGACVEPLADPLASAQASPMAQRTACLTPDQTAYDAAQKDLAARLDALAQMPGSDAERERLVGWQAALATIRPGGSCDVTGLPVQAAAIGDLVDHYGLRAAPYRASGVDMRLILSTAVPGLILSRTACRNLTNSASRCGDCPGQEVELALPGLNSAAGEKPASRERACRVPLGDQEHAALVLVARQRHLSPCDELARSRRQRYALPQLEGRRTPESDCRADACLDNKLRDPLQAAQRCGYTGPDPELACDDHRSAVAAFVELGGPSEQGQIDTLDALVVPDSSPLLQSVNADIRNTASQVDGVLGVAVLSRLTTTVDYPQNRLVLSCRCEAGHTCRTYRGVTYRAADLCSVADSLIIPPAYARSACRL